MLARLTSWGDRIRSSLFFVPMLCVFAGAGIGQGLLIVDAHVTGLDPRLTATVDSARSVLTTVAGATLTFAGIAFSVSLLLISLASSQYSPRVVHGMFRDPFNKRVMGFVIGTFTYCLVVLRSVRSSLDESGGAIVPSVSILVAVVLGIASILSIVAFINHAAHSMDVSRILRRVTHEALTSSDAAWPEVESGSMRLHTDEGVIPASPKNALIVRFTGHGWVQEVDLDRVLRSIPAGTHLRLETFAGKYAIPMAPLAHIWPPPAESARIADSVRDAVVVGETRTLQQDVAYGLRQLVDVALKAMSPGVNDPTTAHEAISHVGTVLADFLRRVPPPQRLAGPGGRIVLVPEATTHDRLVDLAFDELRMAAADHPTVLVYLLTVMRQVVASIADLDHPTATKALARQANLIRQQNEESTALDADRERVRNAYATFLDASSPV